MVRVVAAEGKKTAMKKQAYFYTCVIAPIIWLLILGYGDDPLGRLMLVSPPIFMLGTLSLVFATACGIWSVDAAAEWSTRTVAIWGLTGFAIRLSIALIATIVFSVLFGLSLNRLVDFNFSVFAYFEDWGLGVAGSVWLATLAVDILVKTSKKV